LAPYVAAVATMVILRVMASRWLGRRLVSVANANLLGVILFVMTGIALERRVDTVRGASTVLVVYCGVLVGGCVGSAWFSRAARRLAKGCETWTRRAGAGRRAAMFAAGFLAVGAVQLLRGPGGALGSLGSVWKRDATAEYASGVIEANYAQANRSRFASLLTAVTAQAWGLFLLASGVVGTKSRPLLYSLLFLGAVLQLLMSGGGRTPFFLAFGILAAVFLGRFRRARAALVAMGLVGGIALLALGYLREGRSGQESDAGVLDQIGATIRQDFSYGGMGVTISDVHDGSLGEGGLYLLRMGGVIVPRSLWPSKPIKDPNWEMTEAFVGAELRDAGSISLFTPVGEALFYFGWAGLIVVPLLYGILSSGMEQLYLRPDALEPLRAQTVVWTALAWRLTLWNLFSALVILNAATLTWLVLKSRAAAAGRNPRDRRG
jgi:hypothetical protein